MRTTILLGILLCATLQGLAQSHGISYQAIILSRADNTTEIPGVDVAGGSYLPDQALALRFTIIDQNGAIEYQETHSTTTDLYGLVSLIIGHGTVTSESPDVFEEIDWDGTPKDLLVEVNIPSPHGQGEYMEFSIQELVFAPYAFHRNITATGSLTVDGASILNNSLVVANGSPTHLTGDLVVDGSALFNGTVTLSQCLYLQDCLWVQGTTDLNNGLRVNFGTPSSLSGTLDVGGAADLNSSLDVHGATRLEHTLEVDGTTSLNSTLDVDGGTTLNSTLDVDGSTTLNHTLDVDGATTLNNTLDVDGATTLHSTLEVDGASVIHNTLDVEGRTTITASLSGDDDDFGAYPLRVQGGQHGVAIQVNATDMNGSTNFITFFDGSGTARGRIEGQNTGEVMLSAPYIYENSVFAVELGLAIADLVAASTSSTICLGLGGCVTAPVPSLVIAAIIKVGVATAKPIAYNIFALSNLGVTYESGSADYAEWLERLDPAEPMGFGDVVAMNGGRISKRTGGAERYMVISYKPAVLGNSPEPGTEHLFEKVCFMGQVPVKVMGPVNVGDYILPSGFGNGYGRAVAPGRMTLADHPNIVGRAWSASQDPIGGYVNVAIGMGNNADLTDKLIDQQAQLDELRAEVMAIRNEMKGIATVAGARGANADPAAHPPTSSFQTTVTAEELHPPIEREAVLEAIEMVRSYAKETGLDLNEHPFFINLQHDPVAREAFIDQVLVMAEAQRQRMIMIDRGHGYK
ncbi:MAG: hypothetical protein KIT10_04195 [Flavobacteriales bacterium]|nr:hypothetical protein [Flavobacteriales bacterium]